MLASKRKKTEPTVKAFIKVKTTIGGRDAGLAKTHSKAAAAPAKSSGKHQSMIDKLNDHRKTESDRMEQKRQRDHDYRIEQEKTKRMKYEYRKLAAEDERASRLQAAEADRASRIQEIQLQIELARAQALVSSNAMVTPSQPTASTSTHTLPHHTSEMQSFTGDFGYNQADQGSGGIPSSDSTGVFAFETYTPPTWNE